MSTTIRLKFRDNPAKDARRRQELSGREEIVLAEQEVEAAEQRYQPFSEQDWTPGSRALKLHQEVEAAKAKLQSLRFIFEDSAAKTTGHVDDFTHSMRLRAVNQRNNQFWQGGLS